MTLGPASAGDLEVVSSAVYETGGKSFLQPCLRNNSKETRRVNLKIGNGAIRWTYPALDIPAGETKCITVDAPPLAKGVAHQIFIE